jgi:hypothetical protein
VKDSVDGKPLDRTSQPRAAFMWALGSRCLAVEAASQVPAYAEGVPEWI